MMQPGFYPEMPDHEYHGLPGFSKSVLCNKTPFDYWANRIYTGPKPLDEKEKDYYLQGRLFHCMILEKSEVHKRYVRNEGLNFNDKGKPVLLRRGTKPYEKWAKENPGVSLITPRMWDECERMVAMSFTNRKFRELFELPGFPECSFVGLCPRTGQWIRVRPDYLHKTDTMDIVDLKTTGDGKASPDRFPKEAGKLHYHISGALTLDTIELVTGRRPSSYLFAVTEKPWPYRSAVWELTEQGLFAGRRFYQDRLKLMKLCHETGYFPAYVKKKNNTEDYEKFFRFVEEA